MSDQEHSLEAQLARYQRQQKTQGRFVLSTLAFFVVSTWFVHGYKDWLEYVFADARAPTLVRDISAIKPSQLKHNDYVELTGITEHRGMAQQYVRGLDLPRKEYWYFRLLGSRGVFIEVPPDEQRFDFMTEVTVKGRIVDPKKATLYLYLIEDYHERYAAKRRDEMRILQVGVAPGEGKTPYLILLGGLGMVALINLWMIRKYLRLRKRTLIGAE